MPIPTITSPSATPSRLTDTNDQFVANADIFVDWMSGLPAEFATYATELVDATTGYYSATSTTSVAIGTGSKSFTIQTGKAYAAGDYVIAADSAAPTTNYMFCQVTSYNSGTGALVLGSQRVGGSGTKTSWTINLSGINGIAGDTLPSFSGNGSKFLQLDSGGSATRWTALGYTQIATNSVSASASPLTFTSIPAIYSDLLLDASHVNSAQQLRLELSSDGSSWTSTANILGNNAGTNKGSFLIPKYTGTQGDVIGVYKDALGAAPTLTSGTINVLSWALASGVQAMRISVSPGNITGTFTLYGKL
ncbi:MAG: hypothetical protein RL268_200 [Pseudomonadota bacterium]|jgi:hypothetical protein